MRLAESRCRDLLRSSDHAVLATLHQDRGVDAVPVCFVVDGMQVAVPTDLVKPKSSTVLQRQRNLDADPRAVLLCDHWDPLDWSRLWWVRTSVTLAVPDEERRRELGSLLAAKYRQYRNQPFAGLMVFTITELSGWSAGGDPAART
ncbi:MAG: pyridoxamine 5'-phosphate oxidase family protein [Acidimicrobiales bacterium]